MAPQLLSVVQIQLEQRKVALAEVEVKQLGDKLQQQLDIIKVAGGINSATDKAVALQKEIKRNESRRQQARAASTSAPCVPLFMLLCWLYVKVRCGQWQWSNTSRH